MIGPSVINRKQSDAGYFVVFKNANSDGIGGMPFRPWLDDVPRTRISIQIESPEQQEEADGRESDRQAERFSLPRLQGQNSAEAIPCRHDPDPRNDGIEHDQVRAAGAKLDRPGEKTDVENLPEARKPVLIEAVEQRAHV